MHEVARQVPLDRQTIERLILHAGGMCLLDQVIDWDSAGIHCLADSHLRDDNPLRFNHRLSAVHLIEYGAQAMAIHAALRAEVDGKRAQEGYLAAVKQARFEVTWLDDLQGSLDIFARAEMYADSGVIYTVAASCNGRVLLKDARIVIVYAHE